ncbi:MAG: metalloregulator ArsR/SmtB family transcription factor [Planctomycetota bacterium]
MNELVRISGALADATRLTLLSACLDRELCACQLVALAGLSNAAVSKHLSLLREAGLLQSRKQGRWVHYRVHDTPSPAAADAIAWVRTHGDRSSRATHERMELILAIEPAELSRMQREGCCVIGDTNEHTPATHQECAP